MKRIPALPPILLLLGCDTTTPEFAGVPAHRVKVEKSVFDVRLRGDTAQAIRVNSEWAPRPEAVWPRARIAIEQISGCNIKRMDGDQVVIEARLACDGPPPTYARPMEFTCDIRAVNEDSADVTCRPGI